MVCAVAGSAYAHSNNQPPVSGELPIAVTAPPATALPGYSPLKSLQTHVLHRLNREIAGYRRRTWHWQKLMDVRRTPVSQATTGAGSVPYKRWVLKLWKHRSSRLHHAANRWMSLRIKYYAREVNYMNRVMDQRPRDLLSAGSLELRFVKARRVWKETRQRFSNPPQEAAFLCIHRYEGSWDNRDSGSNGHYGGVQFGKNEWNRFGTPYTGKAWAYQATPTEQLWAAYRYWQVSGFNPWPQTARNCGLL
jgi:hypothetical protein